MGCELSPKSTRGQLGYRVEKKPLNLRQLGVESSLLRGLGGAAGSAPKHRVWGVVSSVPQMLKEPKDC